MLLRAALAGLLLSLLSACGTQEVRNRSSVVDYLYPRGKQAVVQPSIPTLRLPLKVGIAFVPEQPARTSGYGLWGRPSTAGALTEARKTALLETLAAHFRRYDFVGSIDVVPSAYLTAGGGFTNLDQIRTMYGIDVVALVSYDQVQFTDQGLLSLTYWTLVGAYVVSGERNDTSTLMDTAVYDIASRKMLFRAPGNSQIKGASTPVNLAESLRDDSAKGFEQANQLMLGSLDQQLATFRQRLKDRPNEVHVERTPGYSGGGAVDGAWLVAFLGLGGLTWRRRRLRR